MSKGYNQLLAHKVSLDGGLTWQEETIDVAFGDGVLRPGMPIIAKLPHKKYIMVYEIVNMKGIPVFYRITDDLLNWGPQDQIGELVQTEKGSYLTGTPYVTWIPYGGDEGTLLVTGRGFAHVMTRSSLEEGFFKEQDVLVDIDNRCQFTGYI